MLDRIKKMSPIAKKIILVIGDVFCVNIAFLLFVVLNDLYGGSWLPVVIRCVIASVVYCVCLFVFGLYSSMWEYAGSHELFQCLGACTLGTVACIVVDCICGFFGKIFGLQWISLTIYLGIGLTTLFLCGGLRLTYRFLRRREANKNGSQAKRIMLVGAGDMGMIVHNELLANGNIKGRAIIFVDDDKKKHGLMLNGVPVYGGCDRIPELVLRFRIQEIMMCIPSAEKERHREILDICMSTGLDVKVSPSILEMGDREPSLGALRNVQITDLLSRPEVKLNQEVCSYLTGEVVLVTGGGGSIGSEICRQVARYNPSRIVVFDIYENNAFALKNAFDRMYNGTPQMDIRIGSVRDINRLREVFEEVKPSVVFHAAAHKHVPLMEDSPCEAVKNNVFGTFNTAQVADQFRVKKFVLLSTDKAVNPANVMGATKRITEMIVQYFDTITEDTVYSAVRFGNVLGSNGSVIPIFKEQIENGGPVTVTDERITRFFMTIPEAAQLVAQAGGLAKGGEIFVLDMGEPVKILDLAENLIKLSGFRPYKDIDIVFTGLRPGEKLYEELSLDEEFEKRKKTSNDQIFVTPPIEFDQQTFVEKLHDLHEVDNDTVRDMIKKLVPNFIQSEDYTGKLTAKHQEEQSTQA